MVPAPDGPLSAADLKSLPGHIEAAAAALFAGQSDAQPAGVYYNEGYFVADL